MRSPLWVTSQPSSPSSAKVNARHLPSLPESSVRVMNLCLHVCVSARITQKLLLQPTWFFYTRSIIPVARSSKIIRIGIRTKKCIKGFFTIARQDKICHRRTNLLWRHMCEWESVICDCLVEYVYLHRRFVSDSWWSRATASVRCLTMSSPSVAVFQIQFLMVACHCVRQMFDHVFTFCCCVSDSVPDGRVPLRPSDVWPCLHLLLLCFRFSSWWWRVTASVRCLTMFSTVCCCVSDSVPDGGVLLRPSAVWPCFPQSVAVFQIQFLMVACYCVRQMFDHVFHSLLLCFGFSSWWSRATVCVRCLTMSSQSVAVFQIQFLMVACHCVLRCLTMSSPSVAVFQIQFLMVACHCVLRCLTMSSPSVAVFQIQFLMVACHCVRQMFVSSSCSYPRGYAYWIGSYALFFLIMFGDFYRQAYQNTRKQKQQTLAKPETNGAITNGFKKVDWCSVAAMKTLFLMR